MNTEVTCMGIGSVIVFNKKKCITNNKLITELKDPIENQDAVTKKYVDNAVKGTDNVAKKCYCGYVPDLNANHNKIGFVVSASSEFSDKYIAANVFKALYNADERNGTEWVTRSITTNFWITIYCPEEVKVWKFKIRGRDKNTERIYNWKFEGSNDDMNWTLLYNATSQYI
jgi:hypothetical protein